MRKSHLEIGCCFKDIAKRGPGSQAGPDSSDGEEEVNILSCEWDDCDEDFTELKMLMSHVRDHIDNELPTVSHEDDERLGKPFSQVHLTI
jgi:hypothetical protein